MINFETSPGTLSKNGDDPESIHSTPLNSASSPPKGAVEEPGPTTASTAGRPRSNSIGSIIPRHSSRKFRRPSVGSFKGRALPKPGKRRGSKVHIDDQSSPEGGRGPQSFRVEVEQDGSMWVKVQSGRKLSIDSNASRTSSSRQAVVSFLSSCQTIRILTDIS